VPQVVEADAHPTGIVCNRVGYYTIPSLDELTGLLTDAGTCIVENFTVGREGYGNVFFPDSFDVAGLNLDDIGQCFNRKRFCVSVSSANFR